MSQTTMVLEVTESVNTSTWISFNESPATDVFSLD